MTFAIVVFARLFSRSITAELNQKWREDKGLPMNPNAYGVLTDKPDYSYLDGRPTPLGVRQRNRYYKQKEIAAQIILLTKEVDFAVERHKQMQIEAENTKTEILQKKLKPKGELLFKNNVSK